jgi:hypothetical protein
MKLLRFKWFRDGDSDETPRDLYVDVDRLLSLETVETNIRNETSEEFEGGVISITKLQLTKGRDCEVLHDINDVAAYINDPSLPLPCAVPDGWVCV